VCVFFAKNECFYVQALPEVLHCYLIVGKQWLTSGHAMMAGHLSKNRVGSLAFSCFFKKVFGLCIEVHERSFLILSERWMD